MLSDSVKDRILSGMNYVDYTRFVSEKVEEYKKIAENPEFIPKYELLRLNNTRSKRIDSTYVPDYEIKELVCSVNEKQCWLIITEPWCGDSAQNIPYLAAVAALNPLIEIKLILRDHNPDIMDMYLTNGTKSIPILIAFDEEWNELFRWGSRPQPASKLVLELKNQGIDKKIIQEKLHTWYAQNKGKDITSEICEILRTVLTSELL